MKISTGGLEMFAKADLVIGPEDSPILKFDALGVVIVNDEGLALQLDIEFMQGIPVLEFEAEFHLIANTSGNRQEFAIPNLFLDPEKAFLTEEFIVGLEEDDQGV